MRPDTSTTYHVVGPNNSLGRGHDSRESAEQLAMKLAHQDKDVTYTVVQVMTSIVVPSVPKPIICRYA